MKICPRCQKTYTDDNLNFCLEDGTVLTTASAASMPDTLLMSEPRPTQPQQPMQSQPGSQPGAQPREVRIVAIDRLPSKNPTEPSAN